MKSGKKRAVGQFIRTFALWLSAIFLPVVLVLGIEKADENTRRTGYSERESVFFAKENADNSLTVSAFDVKITLSRSSLDKADEAAAVAAQALPVQLKAGARLTKRTADLILRLVFQAD